MTKTKTKKMVPIKPQQEVGVILTIELPKTNLPNGKPKSLAEAFPVDPIPTDLPPRPRATGDPTKTVETPNPAVDPKAAKKLRKQQRKGDMLWVTSDTKTIVSIVWTKTESGYYDRWLVKYDDGAESLVADLSIMCSREHANHHLKVGPTAHRDKIPNKEYAAVLAIARDDAARKAKHYGTSLKNFMSSESVQVEIDGKLIKKAEKETPLTDEQLVLAKRVAELANKLETSPATFVMLPIKLEKLGKVPELYDLGKYGINENEVTIHILQKATQIFRRLEPKIDGVALSQVGKPTTIKESESKPAKKTKEEPKEKKVKVLDAMGSRIGSEEAKVNAVVLAYTKPFALEEVLKKSGVEEECVVAQILELEDRGWITLKNGKYALTS
jgi:hypothetical protein